MHCSQRTNIGKKKELKRFYFVRYKAAVAFVILTAKIK